MELRYFTGGATAHHGRSLIVTICLVVHLQQLFGSFYYDSYCISIDRIVDMNVP